MYVRASRPAEPEEADRYTECADKRWWKTVLGLEFALVVELRLDVLVHVPEEWRDDDEDADQDAEKGEAFHTQVEAVDVDEDDDEGFEPAVEKAVDEGDVEVEEEEHWFGDGHGEGSDEDHHRDLAAGHLFADQLRLAFEFVVAR